MGLDSFIQWAMADPWLVQWDLGLPMGCITAEIICMNIGVSPRLKWEAFQIQALAPSCNVQE